MIYNPKIYQGLLIDPCQQSRNKIFNAARYASVKLDWVSSIESALKKNLTVYDFIMLDVELAKTIDLTIFKQSVFALYERLGDPDVKILNDAGITCHVSKPIYSVSFSHLIPQIGA